MLLNSEEDCPIMVIGATNILRQGDGYVCAPACVSSSAHHLPFKNYYFHSSCDEFKINWKPLKYAGIICYAKFNEPEWTFKKTGHQCKTGCVYIAEYESLQDYPDESGSLIHGKCYRKFSGEDLSGSGMTGSGFFITMQDDRGADWAKWDMKYNSISFNTNSHNGGLSEYHDRNPTMNSTEQEALNETVHAWMTYWHEKRNRKMGPIVRTGTYDLYC